MEILKVTAWKPPLLVKKEKHKGPFWLMKEEKTLPPQDEKEYLELGSASHTCTL